MLDDASVLIERATKKPTGKEKSATESLETFISRPSAGWVAGLRPGAAAGRLARCKCFRGERTTDR